MEAAHDSSQRGFPSRTPGALRHQPVFPGDQIQRSAVRLGTGRQPRSGSPEPDLQAQVRLAFNNLNAILDAAGCTFEDVIDVTVFIVDPQSRFERIWEVVPEFWGQAPHPTVTAVGVTWLYGFDFEIKVIAKLPENDAA
jgi:enamine deaminase RidA (YjgF/YER057c/UK114 family)